MKFIKTSDKKKILKAAEKKSWIGQRGPKISMTDFLLEKNAIEKIVE